jgi:hypothetical protein
MCITNSSSCWTRAAPAADFCLFSTAKGTIDNPERRPETAGATIWMMSLFRDREMKFHT